MHNILYNTTLGDNYFRRKDVPTLTHPFVLYNVIGEKGKLKASATAL